LHFVPAWQ